jgi:diguanylate cyclase (GGDEF)-like protein
MDLKTIFIEKILSQCRLENPTQAGLISCCDAILLNYEFESIFIACASSPEKDLGVLAHSGSEDLLQNCLHRLGVEDRVALSQVPYKIFSDIAGKPVFTKSGTLRMQKPNGGVFYVFHRPDQDYVLMGCVHREPRDYKPAQLEELLGVWNSWKEVLGEAVLKIKSAFPDLLKLPVGDGKAPSRTASPAASKGVQLSLPLPPHLSHRPTQLVDEITHLFNKDYFEECLTVEVERAKRYSRNMSLMMMGVGKPVGAGDGLSENQVAVQVAEVLDKSMRRMDILCRLEKDKYAVILPDTAQSTYGVIGKRIFKHFKQVFGDSSPVFLNLSASSFPTHADDPQALREKVETQLKQAQEIGPNKAVLSE